MSVTELHGLYGAQFHTTDEVSAVNVAGFNSQDIDQNPNVFQEVNDGDYYPNYTSVRGFDRVARFTSSNVATMFGLVPVTGKCIKWDGTHPGVYLYAQKFDECGTGRATGAVHREYLMKRGLIIPTDISCQFQQDLEATYEIATRKDGANDGVVEQDSVALPVLPTTAIEKFTLSKMIVDGVEITGKRSVTISPRIKLRKEGADDDLEPSYVSLEESLPMVTVRGVDIKWLAAANIPRSGKRVAPADTIAYFKRRAPDGTGFDADGSAVHISVKLNGLCVVETSFSGRGNAPGETSFSISTDNQGGELPIEIETGVAIV